MCKTTDKRCGRTVFLRNKSDSFELLENKLGALKRYAISEC